jgi:class 3 adenylate cyclase/tetratricopeptide (TPR) repeat protein
MNCSRCQHANRPGAKFCEECAAPLVRTCERCATAASAAAKFCPECAHPLGTPASGPAPFATPERYTPRHLADKILTSKAALEGERKLVTVLFADLKGSMELLAERDPEDARRILDPVIERLMEAVHHYEGTVNQVMGDGIMALFGAPLAHEDHAVRACYAALRMQESMRRGADDLRRSHGVEVQIRVGMHSGEVVVRSVGSDLRMDYTAVGQTTHLAARMEQLAPPGAVRMTAATLRLAEGYVEVKSLGPIPVKGLAEPVEVYDLTGTGAARTRLQAAALRGLTRFVGRDAEIEHMRRVLGQADAGRGQVVAIVGEAGVGKSRLVHEFTHSHRVQDWLILQAPSVSYGKATSYLPVIELLKGYFRIGSRDDHREMRDKILGRVLGLDRALEPLLPALLALLDVPVDDPQWRKLEPAQRRQRILDAVKHLLLRESRVQPLLIVFEDLHWVDGETQALLDSLVENVVSARLLLLVNYRPEYEHRWGSRAAYSQLRLDALPAASTTELLEALLGQHASLAPLLQMLLKRGNPLFLEETVRTLVETSVLAGERGAYRLTRPVDALQVPTTVQTILAARIDRLSPEDKQLLQAASAIGKDVSFALLAAIAELPEDPLRHGLAHLQEAEFVFETQRFPDLEFTFKHALTHDVAYHGLLGERRLQLHARIVGALERLYADRIGEHVDRLAQHAHRGQLWEKAVQYGRQAGLRGLDRSAPREALAAFEHARAALRAWPDSRRRTELLVDIALEQRDCHFRLGELERLGEVLAEARKLAEQLDDPSRLGSVLAHQSSHLTFLAEHENAIHTAQRACAVAQRSQEIGPRFRSAFILGQALWFFGDPRSASVPLRGALGLVKDVSLNERFGGPNLAAVSARFHLPSVLADLGEFAEAIAVGEEALRIASSAGLPYNEAFARLGLGYTLWRRGEHSKAAGVVEPGIAMCKSLGNRFLLSYSMVRTGSCHLRCGREAQGIQLIEQALEAFEAMGVQGFRSTNLCDLAQGYLLLGRVGEARETVQQALAVAHAHREQAWSAQCLKMLGDVESTELADSPKTEDMYLQALHLADGLGMRPLAAHCQFGLGNLHARTGRRDEARTYVGSAINLYREMGMRFWLEKAESEAAGLA